MAGSKKTLILRELFESCNINEDVLIFSNDKIKEISLKHKFKNPFDVTKIDNVDVLPDEMVNDGFKMILYDKYCSYIIRRNGFYHFIETDNIQHVYIPPNPFLKTKCCSENSCVMFLQKLLINFIEMDIKLNIGIFGRQRNVNINVDVNDTILELTTNQIDIDMSYYFDFNDEKYIIYCELKRTKNKSFNVNQLYHCMKYNEYVSKCNDENYIPILLMIKSYNNVIQISQFEFTEKNKPWSIVCLKSKTYQVNYT